MSNDVMLSTSDNPYDYFTQFDEWYDYDMSHHYDTCGYLARIANVSTCLTDQSNDEEIDRAIDEIIDLGIRPNLIKVKRKT